MSTSPSSDMLGGAACFAWTQLTDVTNQLRQTAYSAFRKFDRNPTLRFIWLFLGGAALACASKALHVALMGENPKLCVACVFLPFGLHLWASFRYRFFAIIPLVLAELLFCDGILSPPYGQWDIAGWYAAATGGKIAMFILGFDLIRKYRTRTSRFVCFMFLITLLSLATAGVTRFACFCVGAIAAEMILPQTVLFVGGDLLGCATLAWPSWAMVMTKSAGCIGDIDSYFNLRNSVFVILEKRYKAIESHLLEAVDFGLSKYAALEEPFEDPDEAESYVLEQAEIWLFEQGGRNFPL